MLFNVRGGGALHNQAYGGRDWLEGLSQTPLNIYLKIAILKKC